MTLVTLGSRSAVGIKDNTNLNTGNWTIPFTPDVINTNVPQFEVYKMVVKGAAGTTFNVYVDNFLWDVGIYGTLNSWDPQQPLILRPGQSLFFAYSDPITDNTPPSATIWLRYDTALLSGKPVP